MDQNNKVSSKTSTAIKNIHGNVNTDEVLVPRNIEHVLTCEDHKSFYRELSARYVGLQIALSAYVASLELEIANGVKHADGPEAW